MDLSDGPRQSCPNIDGCGGGGGGGQAGPPPTQFRILRRPKPNEANHHSNHQQSTGNGATGNQTTALNTNSAGSAKNHMTPRAGHTSEQRAAPLSLYEVEWPSIADAASNGPGSHKQSRTSVSRAPMATEPRAIISRPGASANERESINPDGLSNGNSRSHHPHQQAQNKAPLKTYKERADEYAKARLRILGSAFSDEDKDEGAPSGSR